MALNAMQQLILETLSEQTEGYLTSSDASAFVAKGMDDSEAIGKELVAMQENEWVEFFKETENVTILKVERNDDGEVKFDDNGAATPILDEDGNVQTEVVEIPADEGWIITDKGRAALNE